MRGGEATQRVNQPITARRETTTLFSGGGGGVGGGGAGSGPSAWNALGTTWEEKDATNSGLGTKRMMWRWRQVTTQQSNRSNRGKEDTT